MSGHTPTDVVVVGAGLAGLAAARELQAGGRRVVVLDKGRSVGGRLATRRIDSARFDHGAQFFTQRGPEMAGLVDELQARDLVRVWCRGFTEPDGHPRYAMSDGMNGLAKYLASGLDDVRVGTEVRAVRRTATGWRTDGDGDGDGVEAPALLLTAPVPQSLALIDRGAVSLDPGIRDVLDGITYDAALAVLVVLDGPPALPAPGAVQVPDGDPGPFTFVADNRAKGVSGTHALTLHCSDRVARARWDDDDDDVLSDLVGSASPWIGDARVVTAQLKRWRYATPRAVWPETCCVAVDGTEPLVLAGDAFDGPRVEGAYRSGLAAATALLRARTAV